MLIQVFGINHKTAKLGFREQVMFTPGILARAYDDIKRHCQVDEVLLYSTCARTECVVVTDCMHDVIKWFAQFHGLSENVILQHQYHYTQEHAIKHLMSVAAGIDSQIIGEPQILGQLKQSFQMANVYLGTGPILQKLLPAVFTAAKRVRSETSVGTSSVSLAAAIIHLAKGVFTDLKTCRVMLIGAGEMITLTATHLHAHGVTDWIMVNRTLEKAQAMAETFSGIAAVMVELPKYLAQADIIITATASPVPLLGKGLLERTCIQRKHQPMLIADMAMPRDVEPEVANLADVFLYHIDDLHKMVAANVQQRTQAIQQAEPIIAQHTEHFLAEQRARDAVSIIRDFREKVIHLRDQSLSESMAALDQGQDARTVLRKAAHQLTNKILHLPTTRLRQAASDRDLDVLKTASYLFDSQATNIEEEHYDT